MSTDTSSPDKGYIAAANRLIKIADAAKRPDGTDSPLGEQLREAAAFLLAPAPSVAVAWRWRLPSQPGSWVYQQKKPVPEQFNEPNDIGKDIIVEPLYLSPERPTQCEAIARAEDSEAWDGTSGRPWNANAGYVMNDHGDCIADCIVSGRVSTNVGIANANLIVAAVNAYLSPPRLTDETRAPKADGDLLDAYHDRVPPEQTIKELRAIIATQSSELSLLRASKGTEETREQIEQLKEALRDLLPWARAGRPPVRVGEMTVTEKASRLLGGSCADCGGLADEHVANYYCPEFRASQSKQEGGQP